MKYFRWTTKTNGESESQREKLESNYLTKLGKLANEIIPVMCARFGDRRRNFGLAGSAFILLSVIVIELGVNDNDDLNAKSGNIPSEFETPDILLTTPLTSSAYGRDWASVALSRPLFNPSRSPAEKLVQGPIPPPQPLPKLSGIVITSSKRIAIFSDPEGNPIILTTGAHTRDFKVLSIAANSVRLSGAAGIIILRLDHDISPPAQESTISTALTVQNYGGFSGPIASSPN